MKIEEIEQGRMPLHLEFLTEYRIIKLAPFSISLWFLQFKDYYRILGIKTPFAVWRFIPDVVCDLKKHQCPLRYKFSILSLAFPSPGHFLNYKQHPSKEILKDFANRFPNIEYYLEELARIYKKRENDKIEYL